MITFISVPITFFTAHPHVGTKGIPAPLCALFSDEIRCHYIGKGFFYSVSASVLAILCWDMFALQLLSRLFARLSLSPPFFYSHDQRSLVYPLFPRFKQNCNKPETLDQTGYLWSQLHILSFNNSEAPFTDRAALCVDRGGWRACASFRI